MHPLEYALVAFYLDAKRVLVTSGFEPELEWQWALEFRHVSESDFLREAAWVVFSSGFREAVVRQRFQRIAAAFLGWESAAAIHTARHECRQACLAAFNNPKKVDAVLTIARFISRHGFGGLKAEIRSSGVESLMKFPHIGPVTAFHLAKNIGLDVAKPDRHLLRAAHAVGFESVVDLCLAVHRIVGDPVAVVDSVFWRYATLNRSFPQDLASAVHSFVGSIAESRIGVRSKA